MKFKHLVLSAVSFLTLSSIGGVSLFVAKKASQEASAITPKNDYEGFISTWSQEGHLYLHYNRGEDANDYDDYALWIWQHKPQDIAGSLWAYSGKTEIRKTLTLQPMTTGFMTAADVLEEGNDMWVDQHGAIIDVDMTADIVCGKKGGGRARG